MSDFAKIQCHNVQKMTKIIPQKHEVGAFWGDIAVLAAINCPR